MEHYMRVDVNSGVFVSMMDCERWSCVRQVTLCAIITLVACTLANLSAFNIFMGSIPVALLAVCVNYAMSTAETFKWFVMTAARTEAHMSQAERIFEYCDLKEEDELHKEGVDTEWPTRGEVEFDHVCLRYAGSAQETLSDICFKIGGGMKVGIVGRTGAGKSSLLVALMRIFEITGGCIRVDNVKLSDVGLHDVRKRISIIPQDPVLISGERREYRLNS
tara:strand:- start:35 stop:694 length:660 start_codon:yes stop_codon:yes gene_type:complete